MGRDSLIQHSTHLVGTSNEYFAAAMYMAEGHPVYWPSDQHSPIDFIIKRNGVFLEVQVKTARDSNGYWKCDTVSRCARNTKGSQHYDLLTIMTSQGLVWEVPADLIRTDSLSLGRVDMRGRPNKWERYKIRG